MSVFDWTVVVCVALVAVAVLTIVVYWAILEMIERDE